RRHAVYLRPHGPGIGWHHDGDGFWRRPAQHHHPYRGEADLEARGAGHVPSLLQTPKDDVGLEGPVGVTDVVELDVLRRDAGPQAGASLPAPCGRVRVEPLARHARGTPCARPVRIRFHLLKGGIAEEEWRLRLDPDAACVPRL